MTLARKVPIMRPFWAKTAFFSVPISWLSLLLQTKDACSFGAAHEQQETFAFQEMLQKLGHPDKTRLKHLIWLLALVG